MKLSIMKNTPLSYNNECIMMKLCHPNAKLPVQSDGDVGFDITCVEEVILEPGKVTRVPTGLIPAETMEPLIINNKIIGRPFMKIEGRSGMAAKGVWPVGCIVDPIYRGEIQVSLFNSTNETVTYPAGSRIAQLVIYYVVANVKPHYVVRFVESEIVNETTRGANGFGSSGT